MYTHTHAHELGVVGVGTSSSPPPLPALEVAKNMPGGVKGTLLTSNFPVLG